ncbi:MAG: Secreted protein [Microgenomates bacterium 39_6]|nr:MAG: Secreted protein [Microgenomates bacterium 39_6]
MKIELPSLKIFKKKNKEIPQPRIEEVSIGNQKSKPKKKKTVLFLVSGLAVILLILAWFFAFSPVLALKNNLREGQKIILEAKQGLAEKNLPFLENRALAGVDLLTDSSRQFQKMSWLKIVPVANKYFNNAEYTLLAAEKLLDAGVLTIKAAAPYADILGFEQGENQPQEENQKTQDRIQFLMETGPELAKSIDTISQDVKEAKNQLDKVNQKYLPDNFQGWPIKSSFVSLKEALEKNLGFITGLKPALENLPYFLGQDETRTYLVIFQNDSELRPSGGFLTAYAILEVKDGQVTPVLSQDIYDLDARFNHRIEAPRPIADYLPNVYYWNLRDMNLSPDFIVSMDTFYQYYQTVPGTREVDGILAVAGISGFLQQEMQRGLYQSVFGTVNAKIIVTNKEPFTAHQIAFDVLGSQQFSLVKALISLDGHICRF